MSHPGEPSRKRRKALNSDEECAGFPSNSQKLYDSLQESNLNRKIGDDRDESRADASHTKRSGPRANIHGEGHTVSDSAKEMSDRSANVDDKIHISDAESNTSHKVAGKQAELQGQLHKAEQKGPEYQKELKSQKEKSSSVTKENKETTDKRIEPKVETNNNNKEETNLSEDVSEVKGMKSSSKVTVSEVATNTEHVNDNKHDEKSALVLGDKEHPTDLDEYVSIPLKGRSVKEEEDLSAENDETNDIKFVGAPLVGNIDTEVQKYSSCTNTLSEKKTDLDTINDSESVVLAENHKNRNNEGSQESKETAVECLAEHATKLEESALATEIPKKGPFPVFRDVLVPKRSRVREMFNIVIDHKVMYTLKTGGDLIKWLNRLHIALLIMGHPSTLPTVFKSIPDNVMFEEYKDPEAEFYVKLLLKKFVQLDGLVQQRTILCASEQLANVIIHANPSCAVSPNPSLYLWDPSGTPGIDIEPAGISQVMECFILKLKNDEFYMLTHPDDFYDWCQSTKIFLQQLGLDGAMDVVITMQDSKGPLRPLLNPEAEFVLRSYCLETVKVVPLDSHWCGQKMLYRAFVACDYSQRVDWARSRLTTLMISNDDIDRLRDMYYEALTHAKIHSIPVEPMRIFNIILKRSQPKYQRFGERYLSNNPNTSAEAFFSYLDSANELVYETGAQFHLDESFRKPRHKNGVSKPSKRK